MSELPMDVEARRAICLSLEFAIADIAFSTDRSLATKEDRARLAVTATHAYCGIAAQFIMGRLRDDHDRKDFVQRSLYGHYVVLHTPSDTMFDLETYSGVPSASLHALPFWQRSQAGGDMTADVWVERWLKQRKEALTAAWVSLSLMDYQPRDYLLEEHHAYHP